MDSIFKQRLVGTLMLIALGAVFWPIIFVEPSADAPLILDPVPDKPVVDTSPLPEPNSPEIAIKDTLEQPVVDPEAQQEADYATEIEDVEGGKGQAGLDAIDQLPAQTALTSSEPRNAPPPVPERDAAGYAKSWVLQVATVSSQKRAFALVDRLTSKGYDAFARSVEQGDKTLWRVQIGPRLERQKFEPIKQEIDAVLKVNSTVIRYVR